MALCSLKELMPYAEKHRLAVGAFNVGSMEMLMGVVAAAEETNRPIILQIAEKRLKASPLDLMGPMMVRAARFSNVDIAVQFDHAVSFPLMEKAAEIGFTSIMFDGSHLTFTDNIRETANIVSWARNRGLSLEAEIGELGGSEGGPERKAVYTDPDEAVEFAEKTGCDALSVAIGNAHGHYKGKPKLNFDVLKTIHGCVSGTPLVLHGGSGIPAGDFQKAIELGVRKINIATAVFDAEVSGARHYLDRGEFHNNAAMPDYFGMNEAIVNAVRVAAVEHIKIFNSRDINEIR